MSLSRGRGGQTGELYVLTTPRVSSWPGCPDLWAVEGKLTGRVGPGLLLVSEKFLSTRDGERSRPLRAWRDPFPDYAQHSLTPTPTPTPTRNCLPFPWGLQLTNFQEPLWEGPQEGGWSLGPPITQASTSLLRSTLPQTQKDSLLSPSIER